MPITVQALYRALVITLGKDRDHMSNRDNGGQGGFGPGGFGPGGYGPGGYPMGYPMGMGMPVIIQRGNDQRPQEPQEPPLRVQIAAMLMSQMTRKTMPQVAVTENQIETIPGQKLTEEEEGARKTAMHMLSHYLAGKLEPDIWEQQSLRDATGVPTLQFRCVCSRQDHVNNPDCPFCEGEGTMDIVVKNPRKVSVDANGNVNVNTKVPAKLVNPLTATGQPQAGPTTAGRRPRGQNPPGGSGPNPD
jgi:hypothetical protein